MLLNDFKTGAASSAAAASSLRGLRTRNGVAVRKLGRRELVPVRATAAGGDARRLQSSSSSSGISGKVRGAFSTILGLSTKEAHGPDMVVYQGKVTIMKKLLALDLMDRQRAPREQSLTAARQQRSRLKYAHFFTISNAPQFRTAKLKTNSEQSVMRSIIEI